MSVIIRGWGGLAWPHQSRVYLKRKCNPSGPRCERGEPVRRWQQRRRMRCITITATWPGSTRTTAACPSCAAFPCCVLLMLAGVLLTLHATQS